jgi:hypothetical protein
LIDFEGVRKNEEEVVDLVNDLKGHFTSVKGKVTSIELNRVGLPN